MFRQFMAALVLGLGLHVASAQAALVLSNQTLNFGGANVTSGSGFINVLGAPSATTFGGTLPGGLSTLVPPPAAAANFNFYDDFLLNVPTGTLAAIATSFSFGSLFNIDNLQVRLYGGSTPTLGAPAGGAISSWSTPISAGSFTGTLVTIPETVLAAGNYVLEVRGLVSGVAGGSYTGQLNVAPVPVPGAVWLMGSALALVTATRRRRAGHPQSPAVFSAPPVAMHKQG